MRKSYVIWIIFLLLICILVGGAVWADLGYAEFLSWYKNHVARQTEQNFTKSFPEYGFSITAPCELKDVSDSGSTLVRFKGITDENTAEMTVYCFGVLRQSGGDRLSTLASFFSTEFDDVQEVRIGREKFSGYIGYNYNLHHGLSGKFVYFIVDQYVVMLSVSTYDDLEMKFTEFLNGFSREQNELELERIEKVIETRSYEPIKYGDEWLCGEEIYARDVPQIVHYDRYGNEIIKEEFNEEGDVYKIVKSYYYSPEKGLLEKVTREYLLSNLSEESAYWKRDDEGRLIEIQGYVLGYAWPMSCEYDKQGRRIKVKEDNKYVTYISYPPGNQSMSVELREMYEMGYNHSYEGKKGLRGTSVSFYDEKTGLLKRRITETYGGGYLCYRCNIKYTYNIDGKLVSTSMEESIPEYFEEMLHGSSPLGLTYDPIYRGPIKLSTRSEKYDYDEHGNCIKEVKGPGLVFVNENVYEYNEYGDWVKCIHFTTLWELPGKGCLEEKRQVT